MYDAVSTFYLNGFAGFARIVLRLIRSLGPLIELSNLTWIILEDWIAPVHSSIVMCVAFELIPMNYRLIVQF